MEFISVVFETLQELEKWLEDNKDKKVTDVNKRLLYVTYIAE
jgi:hypothetical protein